MLTKPLLRILMSGGALAIGAGPVLAGGLDRTMQPTDILFANGNYAELSYAHVNPTVQGVGTSKSPGVASGNQTNNFDVYGFAIKKTVNQTIDAALIYDEPFGASFSYPAGTGYYVQGMNGYVNTKSLTGLVKYRTASGFSIFGGPRYETMSAGLSIPTAGYNLSVSDASAFGYVIGTAYELPAKGMRVSVAYNSDINHSTTANETGLTKPGSSTQPFDFPQSVRLDFQSAISATSNVTFMARWSDWHQTFYNPTDYAATAGAILPLVSYSAPRWDFAAGYGHKFNDTWSGALVVGYEPSNGRYTGNLGPTDGNTSIAPVAIYTIGKVKITGSVKYTWIGDAQVGNAAQTASTAQFSGNSALSYGLKLGYSF